MAIAAESFYARRKCLFPSTMRAVCARHCAYALGMKKALHFGAIMMESELLTLVQVAARLHLRPRTVQAWVRLGRIPALRLTRKVIRFDWLAVLSALQRDSHELGNALPTFPARRPKRRNRLRWQ
jgi:hypothetical protein